MRYSKTVSAFTSVAAVFLGLAGCASTSVAPEADKKSPSEIIPITAANLRGQEALYREGWFIVSSTDRAFAYAKEHAVVSSGQAMRQMAQEIARHSAEYGASVSKAPETGVATGTKLFEHVTRLTKSELAATHELAQRELDYADRKLRLAWSRFVKGNMTLAERTEKEREALRAVPGNYFDHLKSDWSNIAELSHRAKQTMSSGIEGRWSEAFAEAGEEFDRAYQRSGTRGNSLSALGDILGGYGRAAYSGVAKPGVRSAVQGGEAVVKLGAKIVFLPVAGAFIVTGRTVQSAGLSLYYTTALGVKLISPTVEGGLLAGMSMLAYGTVPLTYAAGGAVGVVNQVAVTAAAPVVGVGHAVGSAVVESGVYAAQVSFDLVKGVTKVTMQQLQSGIVLGYNALTALPTQVVLGAANGVVFLAWDGPRLVIATMKGEVRWRDEAGGQGKVPAQSLPVGTVVDLGSLGGEEGVKVEIVTDDPQIVQKVLESLPQDLRTAGPRPEGAPQ